MSRKRIPGIGKSGIARIRASISTGDLENACTLIIDTLRTGWDTGGGRRLQQFVWSLWNDFHLVNLHDLSFALDVALSDAVILLFRAAMVGVLTESQKRRILTESGEFARLEECRERTADGQDVFYPPLSLPAEALMKLAVSAQNAQKRLRDERRRQLSNSES